MNRAAIYLRVAPPPSEWTLSFPTSGTGEGTGIRDREVYGDHCSSGVKARRPGLDSLMADARQQKFDVVLVSGLMHGEEQPSIFSR